MALEGYEVSLGKHFIVPCWSFRLNGEPLVFLFEGEGWQQALHFLVEDVGSNKVMRASLEGESLSGIYSRMIPRPKGTLYCGYRCEVDVSAKTIMVFETTQKPLE